MLLSLKQRDRKHPESGCSTNPNSAIRGEVDNTIAKQDTSLQERVSDPGEVSQGYSQTIAVEPTMR